MICRCRIQPIIRLRWKPRKIISRMEPEKRGLYVEPDGDVLPAQGIANQILGNLLRDPWEKIYHPK